MSSFVVAGLIVSVVLGVFMAFLLIVRVIGPIRRLAAMAPDAQEHTGPANEVALLDDRVRGMIADMDRAHSELQQSQQLLMHSEKMALVGKLATEVAHSIRSPMTSINMRLFSLQRNLDLTDNQKEDFEVVAEEMRRLDNIVRNFLEFSRPPKLNKKRVNISWIIDMTLELLEYRLKRHDVEIIRQQAETLPPVAADTELMKEVFVNLIVNACEAMGDGGRIFIEESQVAGDQYGRAVRVSIRDTGPGIPDEARQKILEPFHTTKIQGTGLGLFITGRIIREHGGRLSIHSAEGQGANFIVTLPAPEEDGNG
jgi:signal transduction histidine kinase